MKSSLSHYQTMNDNNLVNKEVYYLNQRLHHLIQVIQQLTAARDLNAIMLAVRTAARQLTGADGATFVLREQDQCYYADEDAISPLWKGGRFPMSACISGWVMLNQQSVVIEDIYADPRIPVDAYRPTFVKSLAMVPIRTRDPIGAIGNYWATHHTPTPEELELLQTLADAAAIALENVYLYEEQEQRIRDHTAQLQKALDFEALLKRITDNVRDSLDERQILATVVQELAQGLDSEQCSTILYNLEQATATVCYKYRYGQVAVACERAMPMSESPELYAQLLQSDTLQLCQLHDSHHLLATETKPLMLVCPIVDDQRVLGDIRLYRTATAPFTELEVRLVQQVANQSAIALRQARLHEAVQAQVQELERLNQLKDDFLSTISHELRSPMATIKMAVQMLKTVLGVVNLETQSDTHRDIVLSQLSFSKAVHYLQILGNECQRETSLINNLLDFVRLEEEASPSILTDVVLQDWVPQVVASFRERIQQQQQQVHINISNNLPTLRTDLTLLNRILTELVQNACKYTPAGETITIAATTEPEQTTLDPSSQASTFLLTVSNSGVEISDRDRDHIFDKFYRIPNSDPWKYGGTGLGLALVKRLVEYMAGSITVTSSHNQVSFTVKLANLQEELQCAA